MPAKPARTQPPLNRILQNRLLLVGMTAATVDDAHTAETGSNRCQNELIQSKPGFLLIEAMQIQPRLYREAS